MPTNKTLLAVVLIVLVPQLAAATMHSRSNADVSWILCPQGESPCSGTEDPVNAEDGTLHKPQKLIDLEQAHDSAPNDSAITTLLAQELFDLAQCAMYNSPASPKYKYPIAYCLYGRVLELDADHEAAREAQAMIEEIYRSLERPLPKCECR
jgi:hypothetical protein